MIRIDFSEVADGNVSLSITGHAGKAEKGQDIVCAAVSTLAQTFAAGIERELKAEITGSIAEGDFRIRAKVSQEVENELSVVCKVFKFGFQKIVKSYPEQVQLNQSPKGDFNHGS